MSLERPLTGKRIVVTRARAQASSLVAALTELGAEVVELPTIEIVPIESYDLLDAALQHIARYQWLIVSSANTVRVLTERCAVLRVPTTAFAALRKVAIGSATAAALREQGIGVDVIPERYVAESLVTAIGDQVGGSRILLARASIARDFIPDELARRGATIDVVDAYRTVMPPDSAELIHQVFSDLSRLPDAVTFTSSSTAKNFFSLLQHAGLETIPGSVKALSIGPVTSATLHEHGWKPTREAKPHDVPGLVAALLLEYRSMG